MQKFPFTEKIEDAAKIDSERTDYDQLLEENDVSIMMAESNDQAY